MDKRTAIRLLAGGTENLAEAARAVGVTRQALSQWPDPLPERIADRVLAVQARRHLPPALLGETSKRGRRKAATAGKGE